MAGGGRQLYLKRRGKFTEYYMCPSRIVSVSFPWENEGLNPSFQKSESFGGEKKLDLNPKYFISSLWASTSCKMRGLNQMVPVIP